MTFALYTMLTSLFGWPEKWPKSYTGSKNLVIRPVDNLFFLFFGNMLLQVCLLLTLVMVMYETVPSKAHFTLEVKANVQLKSSLFIDAKVEINQE
jgi:hypothetical protein